MFDQGGNAIDAAVASGFALNLLEPHNNGLGGEVPILVYSAKEEKVYSISGQGFIGKAATVDWFNKARHRPDPRRRLPAGHGARPCSARGPSP